MRLSPAYGAATSADGSNVNLSQLGGTDMYRSLSRSPCWERSRRLGPERSNARNAGVRSARTACPLEHVSALWRDRRRQIYERGRRTSARCGPSTPGVTDDYSPHMGRPLEDVVTIELLNALRAVGHHHRVAFGIPRP